ncbi:MAG: hypothetical protein AB7I38_19070 [Dehalococcoidia bacterium]
MQRSRQLLIALVAGVAIVGAACTSDDDDATSAASTPASPVATEVAGSATATTEAPAPTPAVIDTSSPSTLSVANPEFNYGAAVWQAYWLSRDHFGPFVMGSGLGIPFEPPMEMLQAAMGMIAQNAADPVMIPANLFPLQAVFASGSPALVNNPMDFDMMDFEGLRLDPATFDERVTVRAQAETMLKESQWARNFANGHFGAPDASFGAQQRFMGLMVNMLAQMQGQYAMQNLMGEDGLYYDSDGNLDYAGNWVMLQTLTDIASQAGEAGGRYESADVAPMFAGAAEQLEGALAEREPESIAESAVAIRALTYRIAYAGTGSDTVARLVAIADGLLDEEPQAPADRGAAIAGLVSAGHATGVQGYLDRAAELFADLEADFQPADGVFSSQDVYTVDDVAWILGGANALVLGGPQELKADAARLLTAFYESTLNVSGMQLSAPPGKDGAMAGEFEKTLPSVVYYHGADTPAPPESGMLTVPAREITWSGGWSVSDTTFDTAGAMHLANELNWFGPHLGALMLP